MKKLFTTTILLACLASVSCGPVLMAQPHQGFTPTSAISPMDGTTWYIGVEALFNQNGMSDARLEFQLPPNRTIVALQGTLAYKSNCFAENLAVIAVDGKQYPMIVKNTPSGGSVNLFIDYSIPLKYTAGNAALVLSNGQVCNTGMDAKTRTTWEFQGVLQIK